ncbi:Uncharacterized conserved protein, DUF2336 family [Devosia crocina]|uniref:Uncharacterized conserved protein, DUF2336 family n=1 Tax=Devosia crocina TaxID=429728 RepID=A0A1I7NCS1_9HYPH|nr:DUF2336 domain-containing protein [Devosia crocina]SFV32346.1 Uncharacterized conserved protein, DUF2336 family [Devosia crocina]
MIEYSEFVRLCRSSDSDERGHAAHLAALAYLDHSGPGDEHAALYAALIGFLDDPSVKVRAALAYGLLHSEAAPRPIIMALLQDSAIISRAVLQYSPILIDADLSVSIKTGGRAIWLAISQRSSLSHRVAALLVDQGDEDITLRIIRRHDIELDPSLLTTLAQARGSDAQMRGALLSRNDLPAPARLILVQRVAEALRATRIVKGALAPERLERLLRDGADTALSAIGETESCYARKDFVADLVVSSRINARVLLHAVVTGHVMFFASCIAELAGVMRDKVFTLLEGGSRASLAALFLRAGLPVSLGKVLIRLVIHARTADLADDVAARHYVVTAMTEEMIADHDGDIPADLQEAFAYLSEQNIALARKAARGVMRAFAHTTSLQMALPPAEAPEMLELPAA